MTQKPLYIFAKNMDIVIVTKRKKVNITYTYKKNLSALNVSDLQIQYPN